MTIIVTGGAGFIGSNFIFHMLKKYPDDRIICLDKLTYAGNLSTLAPIMDNPNFRFVKADICDREAVYKLFEEEHPDIVVNFAAESHVDRSIENPEIFLKTNIIGTATLMVLAASMASSVTIRFRQTRCMAICRLTAPICFLPKKRRFTPVRRTAVPRQALTFWFNRITAPTVCRCQFPAAPTTTGRIIFRKN